MLVFGKNVVLEILKKDKKIQKAYVYKHFNDEEILSALQNKNIHIDYLEKHQLDNLANGNHQGIIVSIPDFKYGNIDEIRSDNGFIVILDHIEDPHNFGAIIRTAEAAGVDAIIIPKDRSVDVNSTVMKTSAGALENMKVVQVTNLTNTIKELKQKGYWFVATDMEGTDYDKVDYKGNIAIVIGNEGSGISRLVKENCDFVATIPMTGSINSLNASVAAGIILFEALKQRR
jgi:23S rRNA (guanosine2251-2'-O)-methyltransferase